MIKRKTRGVAALMSLVVLCGLAMSASAQHEPLPTWDNCPGAHTMFAPLPAFVNGTVGSPVTSWPEVGSYDFCAYMDTLYCQLKPLVAVASEVADYADLLRCLDADINGVLYNQPPAIVPVTISVNSAGECTVYWNNILTHSGIAIPGWSPQADWHMGFGGRTGSLNDYHVVDDFDLVSPGMNYTEFFTTGAGLGTLYGDGLIDSSQLALTENVDSQTGSWSFLPTDPVTEFTVTYMQYIGDGSGADGMCFFYGPGANSAFGEEGPVDTTGLRLTFYTNVPDNVVRLAYNGTTLLDAAPGELRQGGDWLPVSGNGMLDGQYELALLAYVLNTPSHPLHTDAHAAIQTNFIFFKDTIQAALSSEGYLSLVGMMVPYLVGALAMDLAGYATLGDPKTYDALDAVLEMLESLGLAPPPGGVVSVTAAIADVGPYDDFEGDTFLNIEEYFYVEDALGLSVSTYMGYVMNSPTALVAGARYYQVGTTITLSPHLQYGGAVESASWDKDGSPAGTDNPLVIANCLYTDAGLYTMTVMHRMGDAKTTAQVIGTGTVTVGDTPIPAAGLAGLAALSGAIALLTARRMRRRK